jgi:hypothetical protein
MIFQIKNFKKKKILQDCFIQLHFKCKYKLIRKMAGICKDKNIGNRFLGH